MTERGAGMTERRCANYGVVREFIWDWLGLVQHFFFDADATSAGGHQENFGSGATVEDADVLAHLIYSAKAGEGGFGQLGASIFPIGDLSIAGIAAVGAGTIGGINV